MYAFFRCTYIYNHFSSTYLLNNYFRLLRDRYANASFYMTTCNFSRLQESLTI